MNRILKRTLSVVIILILSFMFLILAGVAGFFVFVPPWLESRLIPEMAEKAGIELDSIRVRSIGLRGAELSDIRITDSRGGSLFIDSVRVDYSLSQLRQYNIKNITLSGLSVFIEYQDEKISIGGLDNLFLNNSAEPEKTEISFLIEKVSVRNSQAVLNVEGLPQLHIPLRIEMHTVAENLIPGRISVDIFPEGQRINITGISELDAGRIRTSIWAEDISPGHFSRIFENFIPFEIKGRADLNISSVLDLEALSVSHIESRIALRRTMIALGDVHIKNLTDTNGSELPVEIYASSDDGAVWDFSISDMAAESLPVRMRAGASGRISMADNSMSGNINMHTGPVSDEKSLNKPDQVTLPDMKWEIQVLRDENGDLDVKISGKPDKNTLNKAGIILPDITINTGGPEIEIAAAVNNSRFEVAYDVRIPDMSIIYDDINLFSQLVTIAGRADNSADAKKPLQSAFTVNLMETNFHGYDISGKIPEAGLKGFVSYQPTGELTADTEIFFEQGSIAADDGMVKLSGLSGAIPFKWPYSDNASGVITAGSAVYEEMELGRIETVVRQEKDTINLSGKFYGSLLKGMDFDISGNVSLDPVFNDISLNLRLKDFEPHSEVNLGIFSKDLRNMHINGRFDVSCDLNYSQSGLASRCGIDVNDAEFNDSGSSIKLKGISTSLLLTDLLELRSAPRQTLQIKELSLGDIKASDLTMDFQIESLESILIERAKFRWCGGNINVQSFRIIPESDEYDLTLFCDRINLAELLGQFGVANATGEGAVNGRIPIRFSNGSINIADAFLYSSPGEGGNIRVMDTAILTAGLPTGSREREQLEIASEALKNFEYAWVKVGLDSVGDDLIMNLQFDGKPAGKLPFWYNSSEGRFVRVEQHLEGSTFQGFHLNINFRLPLDRLLNYKSIWDMIE